MDWILGEVLEELKNMHKVLENRANEYLDEKHLYKAPIDTDDKVIAGKHEYWRGRWLEATTNCEEIEELINNVYGMINEEAKIDEEAEEELNYLRGDASGQL